MSYIMIFKMFGKVVKKCTQRDTTVIYDIDFLTGLC